MNSWQVATAAEAIVAAQFARLGFDVSVQYGANQPEYDLIVANGASLLKISVKGSQDGAWGLAQSHLAKLKQANYHGAADEWLRRHKPGTALCLVQFKGAQFDEMPRVYLATPTEIAARLKAGAGGRGSTRVRENHTWGPKAAAFGSTEKVPEEWRLSRQRVEQVMHAVAGTGD